MRTWLALYLFVALCSCTASRWQDCTPLPTEAGDHFCRLRHDNLERTFLLHVPPSSIAPARAPLLVNLHGRKGSAEQHDEMTGFSALADDEGFFVITPNGYEKSWNAGACCGTAHETGVDDMGFVTRLLDRAEVELPIDSARIYVTGFSNGGRMTHALGCALGHRVAAIAPVSAPLSILEPDSGELVIPCTPPRAVSVFSFQGTEDQCNPYAGGDGEDTSGNLSIPDSITTWVEHASCTESDESHKATATTCVTHTGCAEGAEVTLCTTEGAGHIWPGAKPYALWEVCGGEWIDDLDATREIWRFFEAHPLR